MSKTNCKICSTPGGTNLVVEGAEKTSLGFFCRPCQRWLLHLNRVIIRNVTNLVNRICAPSRKALPAIKPALQRRKRHG